MLEQCTLPDDICGGQAAPSFSASLFFDTCRDSHVRVRVGQGENSPKRAGNDSGTIRKGLEEDSGVAIQSLRSEDALVRVFSPQASVSRPLCSATTIPIPAMHGRFPLYKATSNKS